MRRDYPSTRIVVLSSLAQGADRLVAREAIALGCTLVVPLPFEQAEYESDFETAESVAEFRALLASAQSAFVVPRHGAAGLEERSHAYARCAAYIVRHCVELIALWDGRAGSERGGTAETVTFQLEGIPPPYVPESNAFDMALTGPVVHLPAQRATKPGGGEPALVGLRVLYPATLSEGAAADAFEKLKRKIERFNCDALRAGEGSAASVEQARVAVEAIAGRYQRHVTRSLMVIFLLVFFAAAGFNVYLYLPNHPAALLVTYLALSAVAFGISRAAKSGEWQDRYQDARALAEALRVAHYWDLAHVRESVADCIARAQFAQIDWVPVAVRALTEEPGYFPAPEDAALAGNLRLVNDEWIADQREYFAEIAGRRDRTRELIAGRMAVTGVIFSVVISIALRLFATTSHLNIVIALVATTVALGAALLHGYAEKRGWSEHARRYDRMALLFARAQGALAGLLAGEAQSQTASVRARTIVRRLGEEAIRENVSWLALQRTRPVAVPMHLPVN
ncbi:MAG TPA: hypothetical protein VKR56_07735 [Candidatus Cybelea sp.]|nr:hypothetical protein [Candidatus Cybelea sp.]